MATGRPIPGDPTPTVLIGRAEVLRRAGLKKSTMYVLIKKGLFPRQVQKTDATVGWVEAEVEAWIQDREALRPGSLAEKGAEVPTKPIANPASPSPNVRTWPGGMTLPGQLQGLDAEQINRFLGRGSNRPKVVEPQYFFDPASGTLWLRILKV